MRMSGVSVTYGIMALMAQQTETGTRSGTGVGHDRQPDLGPDRRRLPVGHPGRRRQGQGAPGPGRERHRLRRRRARLPHARRHRGGRRGRLPRPEEPPVHADRRPARAARGDRRQDRPRLRARGGRLPGAGDQRGQAGGGQRLRRPVRPGDEVLVPAPYWTTYPESIALAGGVPVVVPTDAASGFRVTVDQLEAARTPPHQGPAVRLAVQPDRCGLPEGGDRGHRPLGRGARRSGWSPTRSTSTWSTAVPSTTRCRSWCPSWPTPASW